MKEKSQTSIVLLISIVLFFIGVSLVKAEAAAKPVGTLTVALPTLGEEGFLPDRTESSAAPLWECVYNYLIYDDSSTNKPIPGLAERWEYSKDYRSLTFWLRKGIQFHDGWGELTAEDVKFTIEFNGRPTSTNSSGTELKKSIESIEVVDRYTLVIHSKRPDPTLWLSFYVGVSGEMAILCKKYIETVGEEKANRQPIGTGPYRFVESKLGEYAKFEALEKHWLVVPEFKYLILRVVPEESTRIAMLKTGEVDIATELDITKLPELEKAGLRPIVIKNSLTMFLPFGGMLLPEDKRYVAGYHRMDPWKDIRVREAMNIAIDRKSLVKTFFQGTATAAPIYPIYPGWDKLKPIPYDPKRAKQLLTQVGYPDGFSFKLVDTAKQPVLKLLVNAVAGYWEEIGLKAEIVPSDYATWRTKNKSGKTAGYIWINSQNNRGDWSGRITAYDFTNAATPFWASEETDAAIIKVREESDPQKKIAYFKELSNVYRSIYPHVPLVYAPRLHGATKKVGEWHPGREAYMRNLVFVRHVQPLNTYRLFSP